MQKNGKRDNSIRKYAIDELFRGGLSKKTNDLIDRLLLDQEDDPEYVKSMLKVFEEEMSAVSEKPSAQAQKSLIKLKKRLRMDAPAPKVPLYRRTYFRVASAAAAVLLVVGVSFVALRTSQDTGTVVVQVEVKTIGEVQKDVLLADSSRIWVAENSKLTYPESFNGEERHVHLEGKAYFAVAKNEESPFLVHTAHLDVQVLGTEFDVREHPDREATEVTLYKGSVEVSANDETLVMSPGEIATYDHLTKELTLAHVGLGADGLKDWRSETIFTHDKTISQLLRMVENYYEIPIVFDSLSFPANERYSFGFDKGDSIETVMTVLSEIGNGFAYEIDDSKAIHISP